MTFVACVAIRAFQIFSYDSRQYHRKRFFSRMTIFESDHSAGVVTTGKNRYSTRAW